MPEFMISRNVMIPCDQLRSQCIKNLGSAHIRRYRTRHVEFIRPCSEAFSCDTSHVSENLDPRWFSRQNQTFEGMREPKRQTPTPMHSDLKP